MISMMIMLIVFLSFATAISYGIMTMNQNLIVTGDIQSTNNELNLIKQALISSAKPIESSTDYSLPYGVDDTVNDRHTLPTHLNIPIKNTQGYYYQYCPYAIVDSTSKTKLITQNDNTSYNVATKIIDSVEYVTHSESAHSFSSAPDVLAFIMSTQSDNSLSCLDILYDSNVGAFYADNAKVVEITKTEIQQYNAFNNLSGVTESLTVDSSSFSDVFSIIENDVSNKSYEITLSDNTGFSGSYRIEKKPSKRTSLSINTGGYQITGDAQFHLKNIDLELVGTSTAVNGSWQFPRFYLTDSNAALEDINTGSLTLNNSKIILDNSHAENISYQVKHSFFNSDIIIRNDSTINHRSSSGTSGVLHLVDSNLIVEDGATLTINKRSGTHTSLISLNNSNLSIYGTIQEGTTLSTSDSVNGLYVDSTSRVYLNGGHLSMKGNLKSLGEVILLKGQLVSEGNANSIKGTSISNVANFIRIKGGEMALSNISIGQGGGFSNVTIKEDDSTLNSRGIAKLIGSGIIYRGSNGCFDGEIFKNLDTADNSYRTENSGSDFEVNNMSDYSCN